jgi:hypothetical protein
MQIFLHLPHVFTTVGHEHYLLVLLHPLRLHHLPHPLPLMWRSPMADTVL